MFLLWRSLRNRRLESGNLFSRRIKYASSCYYYGSSSLRVTRPVWSLKISLSLRSTSLLPTSTSVIPMTTIREMRRNFVLLLGIRSNVLFSLHRCDRVLYHLNENVRKDTLTVQKYDHVLDMQASDHKPVYCLFNMKVKHHNKKEMKAIHSQIEKDLLDIDTTDIADVLNDLFSVRS